MKKHKCPIHKTKLLPSVTRFGIRHDCPIAGCTVALWNGSTSTPADQVTRYARQEAHVVLTAYCAEHNLSGGEVYEQMSVLMCLSQKKTHIGHFNLEQCQRVITHFSGRGAT